MDELPEFKRTVLDVMRQPLEDKEITLMRSGTAYRFPADTLFVAAMNPCPCGYYPDKNKCTCSPRQVQNYISHISGPILNRMDIVAETTSMKEVLKKDEDMEEYTGEAMQTKILTARKIQENRMEEIFGKEYMDNAGNVCNGRLGAKEIKQSCFMTESSKVLLNKLLDKYAFSGRAYFSLLKVARTIADLEKSDCVREEHLAEAAGYRLGFERYFYG